MPRGNEKLTARGKAAGKAKTKTRASQPKPAKARPRARAGAGKARVAAAVVPERSASPKPAAPRKGARGGSAAAPTKPRTLRTSASRAATARKAPARSAGRRAARPVPKPEPLTDEERIESSKYEAPDLPRRLFEEERFVFPESYDTDRVRLLVKDPSWLFAHWDVSQGSWGKLQRELGERAFALARLTLKLEDPANGSLSVVLLPGGARSWYLRTHASHRAYRAQLGVTIPSGEFRRLATSNVVVTPRVGASPEVARRVGRFGSRGKARDARALEMEAALAQGSAATDAAGATSATREVRLIDGEVEASGDALPERGGASELLARGGRAARERGGASETFRR
jgi:hypothetical protein